MVGLSVDSKRLLLTYLQNSVLSLTPPKTSRAMLEVGPFAGLYCFTPLLSVLLLNIGFCSTHFSLIYSCNHPTSLVTGDLTNSAKLAMDIEDRSGQPTTGAQKPNGKKQSTKSDRIQKRGKKKGRSSIVFPQHPGKTKRLASKRQKK